MLESKLCSLFNLQTESAIVMASHGYILGAHMNKRTLPNNVIYIIDKMKANQECSSNENTWVLRIPSNVVKPMFIWVKFVVCTHIWGSKESSCVPVTWTTLLKQLPMLSSYKWVLWFIGDFVILHCDKFSAVISHAYPNHTTRRLYDKTCKQQWGVIVMAIIDMFLTCVGIARCMLSSKSIFHVQHHLFAHYLHCLLKYVDFSWISFLSS